MVDSTVSPQDKTSLGTVEAGEMVDSTVNL